MTVDGLGFEELGQAQEQTANLFITGSINAGQYISGLNLFATGSVQSDKIVADVQFSGAAVNSSAGIVGVNISGTTAVRSPTVVGTTVSGTELTVTTGSFSGGVRTATNFVSVGSTITESVFATTTVSGANVYATGSAQAGRVFGTVMVSGAQVIATGSFVGINANLTGSVTDARGRVNSIAIGSATTQVYGGFIQTGSALIGAGSSVWVVFGQAFATRPYVQATYSDLGTSASSSIVGSQANTGSVLLTGDTASKDCDWLAIGT